MSVLIDNYNYGRFLARSIESVLDQDYPADRLEIVLIDDGSTDDSLSVAARFGARIRVIAQANAGQAGAFNNGIPALRGELVCLLDSDDFWEPSKISEVAAAFADPGVGIVQHLLREADEAGRPLPTNIPAWPEHYDIKDYLSGRAALAAASGLSFRREILRKVIPMPLEMTHASDTYLLVHGLLSTRARNLSRILGCHRLHGGNNWAGFFSSAPKLEMSLRLRREFRRRLEPRLQAQGLAYSPFFLLLEQLDAGRDELILDMHRGRRSEAWAVWRRLWAMRGRGTFAAFRALSLLPALVSPACYLRLHRLYGVNRWLVGLREALANR